MAVLEQESLRFSCVVVLVMVVVEELPILVVVALVAGVVELMVPVVLSSRRRLRLNNSTDPSHLANHRFDCHQSTRNRLPTLLNHQENCLSTNIESTLDHLSTLINHQENCISSNIDSTLNQLSTLINSPTFPVPSNYIHAPIFSPSPPTLPQQSNKPTALHTVQSRMPS